MYDDLILIIWIILLISSALVIYITIFVQKKRPEAIMVWILTLIIATLFGILLFVILPLAFVLLLYILLGRDYRKRKMFKNKMRIDQSVGKILSELKGDYFVSDFSKSELGTNEPLARMLFNSNKSFLTYDNEVEYYNEGGKIFQDMIEEIKGARRFVHMEFYMVRNDSLTKEFAQVLAQKAKEGVEVKLLMDASGCYRLPKRVFKDVKKAGGKVAYFLPSVIYPFNLSINNRNHRKLVVVDGDTAFVGGTNIGVEYRGEGPLGYWRDDNVRIRGSGAISVEKRFVLDWNFAAKDQLKVEDHAPTRRGNGKAGIQIISGGPDKVSKPIEEQYVKMITSAKEYVYIQTPYFVPTEAVTAALVVAARSGVDVRVMMPSKPDHVFIYWASLFNAGHLLPNDVRIFQFNSDGFIHAKVVVMDDSVSSIGSANFDHRSLEINFESNAVVYDQEFAKKVKAAYLDDIEHRCTELTANEYDKRSRWVMLRENISRLYGPVA